MDTNNRSFVIIIVAFSALNSLMVCLVTRAIPVTSNISTDQQALLALKAHLIHDPSNSLTYNWSPNTPVCNWLGVTCSSDYHRVVALDISYLNLTGTIPHQLGNLTFLEMLALRNNSFYGSLPENLAQLRRLEYINFMFNNFNTEIPSWLGSFTKLQYLNLNGNNFRGSIPPSLINIASLEALHLGGNQLSGSFPSIISNISSLEVINFVRNRLSGELPPDIFQYLPNLKSLYLHENTFEGQIPPTLSECKQLQTLSLSVNNFAGVVPKEIGNLTKLKGIFIGLNRLQGEIPPELGNLVELEVLTLESNFLTGQTPSVIYNISSLIAIVFAFNNLTGSFPDNMCENLPALQILHMSGNQFSGPIPSNLWQCQQLRVVSLSENQLQGRIPRDLGNLTMLKKLYLGTNNLGGEIPNEIGNLHNLEILGFRECNLGGQVPASIFNISTLKELALTSNNLWGSLPSGIDNAFQILKGFTCLITVSVGQSQAPLPMCLRSILLTWEETHSQALFPTQIGNLARLEVLTIGANHLTSSTPDLSFLSSLTNCRNLRLVQLTRNPLNGILPTSIGNLSASLEMFLVDECNISGNIPKEIGNLENLTVLDLRNNKLSGSVPVTLGRLRKLQGLYLQNNKLQGPIPYDICHLQSLVELYLNDNKISGSMPTCLDNLISMRDIFLNSNWLNSSIPSTLWKLKDILHLNLASNFFNCPLLPDIGNLKVVIDIDLSRNQLTGDIPTTIGGLKDLQHLSLTNNKLQGPVPESFGELTSLEFLDLSSNNLSGGIPKSLEVLLYLKYLNLSFNWLEGEIPSGGPFANFSSESFFGNHALCGSSRFHVPPCKTSIHSKSRTAFLLRIVLPLSITIALLVLAAILLLIRCQKKCTNKHNDVDMPTLAIWRRISYESIRQATNRFSESNLLGTGSFGSVYRGRLSDGTEVAIKVFNLQLEGAALKSFDAECEVMSTIHHRNLVKIISSCSNEDFKALILEHMPNGCLHKCLYSNEHFLDISQRLNIMIDVASALEYIHFGSSIPIIHCDLKPRNILLDENMVAHLSDFGIAKLLGEETSMTQTQTLATIGYMAPEYGREGKVSRKGDVYSYGVVLMETFTKKKPTEATFDGDMSLRKWVSDSLLLNNTVMEVVDNDLLRKDDEHFTAKEQCLSSILSLAIECTRESPEERIEIKVAARRLSKIKIKLLTKTETKKGRRSSYLN